MLPILDLSPFLQNPQSVAARGFADSLVAVCHDPGFFFLRGHGISKAVNADLMSTAKRFFALPKAQRHAIAIGKSPHFRGYTILGDERTGGKRDWRDQLDIGPEENALDLADNDPPWLRLRGPNQWPGELPEMPSMVNRWAQQMRGMALELFRALAMGLGHDYQFFDHLMSPNPYYRIKISRYPGQLHSKDAHKGLGLHHDSGLFTFITQNDVPGLQVERDGKLHSIEPVADAFIVNLGEMFQIATSGFLKATKHQVCSPPPGEDRISIAYFMNPRLDAVFKPVSLPQEYAALARGGQNDDENDPVYETFGENTLKIRMRAHPDVKSAFYGDVNL